MEPEDMTTEEIVKMLSALLDKTDKEIEAFVKQGVKSQQEKEK